MKPLVVPLVGSLVANAVLVAVLLKLNPAARNAPSEAPPPLAIAATSANKPAPPGAEAWSGLNEGTLEDLAARLRAENFPLSVQRAILALQLNKRFAARRVALAAAQAALPYWRTDPDAMFGDPRLAMERRALQRDFDTQLRRLVLPGSTGLSHIELAELRQAYGNPPTEKIERMRAIQIDYDELATLVRTEAKLRLTPADREALAELERQRRADLAAFLTPAELENYELRASPTSKRLSDELYAFNFNPDEFRALFRIQQDIDARFGSPDDPGFGDVAGRREAEAERLEQFRAALGVERFATYQLSTAPGYLQTKRLVVELGLPATTTAEVIGIQRDITQRAERMWMNQNLSVEQREAQRAALAQEASTRLAASLGPTGVTTYAKEAGGWFRNLQTAASVSPSP